MADEQYRWLDRETAERLLSGEPPGAVERAGRDQAEHLAKTLGALSATPPLTSDELPGEAAAMAAFRKARAERADAAAALASTGGSDAAGVPDAGLVRIGTPGDSGTGTARPPRWARPARLALAAVLAVGMVGGAALAAGTGALRSPFGGDEPDPGASVSASVTHPERPLVSPSPSDAAQGGSTPDDAQGGSSKGGAGGQGGDGKRDDAAPKPDGRKDGSGVHRGEITAACRDLRDGKRLDPDHRRALRHAANGQRVWKYCKGVLSSAAPRSGGRGSDDHADKGRHQGKGSGRDGDQDRKQDADQDRKQDKAERKADRKAEKRAEKKDDDDDGADRGGVRTSLAPLRPAVSHSLKTFWPTV
ncbi:hypothetical protein SAMN06272771_4919 [Streptomyces sp. Ag82_O1-12]|uniref:hypothetical protein n=1 Tax=unclassified Streptomyces TaxID=2593676 RepID=UPI000BD3DE87|nr:MULTISPECIES: hypothetical protein [unclassified Streptomyces]SMQ18466.1 hypothetical protein SAMN06272771_4919 [Streptomyces sp. Ag82_O1-12]SOD47504.1 hypothetical protein SAMN06272727_4920 [Streptomyces sp. Ag82_G6-1]